MAVVAGNITSVISDSRLCDNSNLIGGIFEASKNAPFIGRRAALFDAFLQEQKAAQKDCAHPPITISLPDGKLIEGNAFVTTPYNIAAGISKGLAQNCVVAKVLYDDSSALRATEVATADSAENDEDLSCSCTHKEEELIDNWILWDLTRPLEASCKIKLLKFDDNEARHVFWHSSSHILGQCLEREFGALLTIGPALERGYYYDCYLGDAISFNQEMYGALEEHAAAICKENQPFERLVITKEQAIELFKENPFKVQLINSKIPDGGNTSCYKCGNLVDLCRGPHIPSTALVKAFSIEKHSSSYWLGDAKNDSLRRVYGIAFPDAKQLKAHKTMIEEAKKRDHRLLGNTLNLYFFDTNLSPGSAFWLPDGAKIYNKMCNLIRSEYRIRGFDEVITPNIYSVDLFKVSGHYQNYKDNMYMFDVEGKEWGLKPMNCPGHCLMFKHLSPSYRQLPLRMADFGVLHRNEVSGSLSGLTRVRRFRQDDAHIFLHIGQIKEEVASALDFLFYIYDLLGFTFELRLSTRPKKAMGGVDIWKMAEAQLAEALDACGKPWAYNHGDGAFYGPKIDVRLQDALQRWHQCGTIQLDFLMPQRFNLYYRNDEVIRPTDTDDHKEAVGEHHVKHQAALDGSWEEELKKGYERPVMIHRAILGSVERMCAVMVEHTGGKFPFWISSRQAIVCPISEHSLRYASWVHKTLHNFGYDVNIDDSNRTVNKKIREAQINQWNYILVVGAKEESASTVTVRIREDPTNQKTITMEELLKLFSELSLPTSQPLNKLESYKPCQFEDVSSEQKPSE